MYRLHTVDTHTVFFVSSPQTGMCSVRNHRGLCLPFSGPLLSLFTCYLFYFIFSIALRIMFLVTGSVSALFVLGQRVCGESCVCDSPLTQMISLRSLLWSQMRKDHKLQWLFVWVKAHTALKMVQLRIFFNIHWQRKENIYILNK